jgi:hypothetical protein
MMLKTIVKLGFLGVCGVLIAISMAQARAIDITNQRQLFLDNTLIDSQENVRLVLHHPHDEGPVLRFDKPWEGAFCGYATVIKDQDIYRLYYRGLPKAGKDGSTNEKTCYAESRDGIRWDKPVLRLFEVDGSWENNVILANAAPVTHNFSPFLDSNPAATPKERYKALGGTQASGLMYYVSADGKRWRPFRPEPVLTQGAFDSQNVAFWSQTEGCYVCYFRTWSKGGYKGFRTVSRCTSKDFINWSDPVPMEFGDTPWEHLYTNQTHPYFRAPQIYLAIAARFLPGRQVLSQSEAERLNVNPKYFKDCSDAVLMSSRGGTRYDRRFMEGFIRPGMGLENWVSRSNYPALNVVPTGADEMSVYVNCNYAQPTANLRRYSLRLDGFVSVWAPYTGGELVTRPFTFSGDFLEVNFATSAAGGIQIEVQDTNGIPIPGFGMDQCPILIGNEISRKVKWIPRSKLAEIKQPIRLRFRIKDADVYSFRFFK